MVAGTLIALFPTSSAVDSGAVSEVVLALTVGVSLGLLVVVVVGVLAGGVVFVEVVTEEEEEEEEEETGLEGGE